MKPANVLLDDDCHAVLIDFGMSKRYDAVGDQTSTTPVGISHGYAPLEQYKQDGVGTFSPATDIYSLGATFYKLLTGATPPDASDLDESVLSSGLSVVSAPVRETILQSMQLKRKDRPQSMDAFLTLLEPSSATADDVDDEETTMIDIPEPSTPSSPTSQAPEPPTVPDERPSRKWLLPLVFVLVVALGIFGLTQIPGFGGDDDESLSPDTLVHLETVAVPLPVANDSMRKHEMTKPDKVATTGVINGHEYVDLGLSVKWGTMNVGATSPGGYGNYFAWGEVHPKSEYTEEHNLTYDKYMENISGNSRYDAAR